MKMKLLVTAYLLLTAQLSYAAFGHSEEGQNSGPHINDTASLKTQNSALTNAQHEANSTPTHTTEPTIPPKSTPVARISVDTNPLTANSMHLPDASSQSNSTVISSGELSDHPTSTPTPDTTGGEDINSSSAPKKTTIKHDDQSGGWFTPSKKSSTTITDHGDGTHSITSKDEIKNWWSSTAKVKSTTEVYDTSNETAKNTINNATADGITKNNVTAVKKAIQDNGKHTDTLKAKTGQKRYSSDGSSIENTYSIDSDGNQIQTKSTYDPEGNLTGKIEFNLSEKNSDSTKALVKSTNSKFNQRIKIRTGYNTSENTSGLVVQKPATKFYNSDGHFTDITGKILTDENGNLVTQNINGEWINSKGQPVDEYGQTIESSTSSTPSPTQTQAPGSLHLGASGA